MENKDKYYTPSIEEFHVGFEYEQQVGEYGFPTAESPWIKKTFYDLGILLCNPRVKYLDREDIESLGFKQVNEEVTYYTLNNFNLFFEYTKPTILIDQRIISSNGGYYDYRVFKGILKNKSELFSQLKRNGVI